MSKLKMKFREIWRRYVYNEMSLEDLQELLSHHCKIETANLNINNVCNLKCSHCFIKFKETLRPEITSSNWHQLIDQFISHGTKKFHICGKEPFMTAEKLFEVLAYLRERKKKDRISYGVITNGIMVDKFIDQIKGLELDYLDFSVDGLKTMHQKLRGVSSFARTITSIEKTAKDTNTKIWVSSVIHRYNFSQIPHLVRFLLKKGVRSFFYQPMIHLGKATSLRSWSVVPEEYYRLMKRSRSLLKEFGREVPIEMKFDIYSTFMSPLFERNTSLKDIFVEFLEEKTNSTSEEVGKSILNYQFNACPLCVAYWKRQQVTPDGYYIGCDVMMSANNYSTFSVGNLKDEKLTTILDRVPGYWKALGLVRSSTELKRCSNCKYFFWCKSGCRLSAYLVYGNWEAPDPMCPFEIEKRRQRL